MNHKNALICFVCAYVFCSSCIAQEIQAFGKCKWDWSFIEVLQHLQRVFPKDSELKVIHLNHETDGRGLRTASDIKSYLRERIENSFFKKPKELPGSHLEKADYVSTVGYKLSITPLLVSKVPCTVTYYFENEPGLLLVSPRTAIEVSYEYSADSSPLSAIFFNKEKAKANTKSVRAQVPLLLSKVKIESLEGVVESSLVEKHVDDLRSKLETKYGSMDKVASGEWCCKSTDGVLLRLQITGKTHHKRMSLTYEATEIKRSAQERYEELSIKEELKLNKGKLDIYKRMSDQADSL